MTDLENVRLFASWAMTRADYSVSAALGKALTILFVAAPREGIQDEILLWQRRLTIHAHTARKRAETKADALLKRIRSDD